MNMINPNSFVTLEGEYLPQNEFKLKCKVEITISWKQIYTLEMNTLSGEEKYWLILNGKNDNDKVPKYLISKQTYEFLKNNISKVDFDIPTIKMVEKIDEMVTKAIIKGKTAIESLEVCTE